MENSEVVIKTKNSKGVIVLLIILILIVLGLSGYLVYDKFIAKDTKTTTINEVKTIFDTKNDSILGKVDKITLNVKEMGDSNKSVKINDNFTIKIIKNLNNAPTSEDYGFDVYVNEKLIMSDWTFLDYYDFEIIYTDNYVFFTNIGSTDIRSTTVYVVSKTGELINKFYELEEIEGMVPSKYSVEDNTLIIDATRVTHGPGIVYGKWNDACEQIKSLESDLIVEGKYIYKLKNNKFELTDKKGLTTLSQFISRDRKDCLN